MNLLDFCITEKEKEYVSSYMETSNFKKTAKLLGRDESTVRRAFYRVRDRASIQGFSPEHEMTRTAPNTHVMKGTSTLYDKDGNISAQWVKMDLKKEAILENIQAIVEGMKDDIVPLEPSISPADPLDDDLLTLYPIADPHLGMLAWGEEGGENYDLKIAEDRLKRWFDYLLRTSPNSSTAVISSLGDLLHSDSYRPETPTSKNILDADSRFPEIVRASVRVIRYVIDRALTKHNDVYVVFSVGNHDISSTVWIRELFLALYENDSRVHIDKDPRPYGCFVFGNVMLGFHHGHIRKPGELPLLFAAEYSKEWGQTEYRYAHVGHRHHQEIKEHSGMTVEQHSTMAARDAHASWGGWHNKQKVNGIVYHSKYGEVGRITATPQMI